VNAASRWFMLALAFTAGCRETGPRDVALGTEQCAYCHMTISDPRFVAQLQTDRGRIQPFDAIECAAGYARAAAPGHVTGAWVSDFNEPGQFIAADSAAFWRVEGRSPMGGGWLATAGPAPRGEAPAGPALRWADVLSDARVATGHEGHDDQ
jgi:copper chaperone NosL